MKGDKIVKNPKEIDVGYFNGTNSESEETIPRFNNRSNKYKDTKAKFELGLEKFIEYDKDTTYEAKKELHMSSNFLLDNPNLQTGLNQNTSMNLRSQRSNLFEESKSANVSFR